MDAAAVPSTSAAAGGAGAVEAAVPTRETNQALDRSRTLQVLAGAMSDACEGQGGAKVDLKAPQVS
jgi:hypothetical protein